MPREFPRHVRIAESIRRVLAEPVMRAGRDAGVGMLTITYVNVAPDLTQARVSVSALAPVEGRDPMPTLRDLRPAMRQIVARELNLKKIPVIFFELDDSIARAARIGDLLNDRNDT
jgi:ribosome-binding factor A